MNDWANQIVDLARRLPVWVRILIGAAAVLLVLDAVIHLAGMASTNTPSAILVGVILAAWVVVYLLMRRARKKPPF
jgi:hypothetical protein